MTIAQTYIVRENSRWVRLHRVDETVFRPPIEVVNRWFIEVFLELHGDAFYTGLEEITYEQAEQYFKS